MKVIEQKLITKIKKFRSELPKVQRSKLSDHDYVEANEEGVFVTLWNSEIAYFDNYKVNSSVRLGTYGGRYRTQTTKRRLNAIATAFKLPTISQRNFIWYWSDGVEYIGKRTFVLKGTDSSNPDVKLNELF